MEIIFITINKILHTLIGGVLLNSCGQKKPISHDFMRSQEEPKVAKLREQFRIVKGRSLIKSVIHKCVGCKLWSNGNYQLPLIPPLSLERVEQASPFFKVGIDYLGPVNIRAEASVQRVYIVIFACLVTRAVYLPILYLKKHEKFLRK